MVRVCASTGVAANLIEGTRSTWLQKFDLCGKFTFLHCFSFCPNALYKLCSYARYLPLRWLPLLTKIHNSKNHWWPNRFEKVQHQAESNAWNLCSFVTGKCLRFECWLSFKIVICLATQNHFLVRLYCVTIMLILRELILINWISYACFSGFQPVSRSWVISLHWTRSSSRIKTNNKCHVMWQT